MKYACADKEPGADKDDIVTNCGELNEKTTITTIPKFKTEVVAEVKKDSMSCLIFNVFIMSCVSSSLACLVIGTRCHNASNAGLWYILGFHVTSQYFPNMDVRHICALQSVKLYGNVSLL